MSPTPTLYFAVPERLLDLGAGFTRHHDALTAVSLVRGSDPAGALSRHVPVTQALARGALDALYLRGLTLYHSPSVRAGLARMKQLAALATSAADQLLDAVDILHDARRPAADPGTMSTAYREALWEAGRRISLALQLTALGADDCLDTADVLVRQMRLQKITPEHQPPPLSPAQLAALHAVARGYVTIHQLDGKVWVRRGEARVTISTIRALEARGLVRRETCPLPAREERIHLSPEGCRTLAATLGRPRTTAPTARPAVRSALNTGHSAAR